MPVRLDKKFDRYVTQSARIPLGGRGQLGIGNNRYEGFIKCKLAHANYGSFVVPDFLFVGKRGQHWLQPLSFGPPVLSKFESEIRCEFSVDIAGGHRLKVDFANSGYITRLLMAPSYTSAFSVVPRNSRNTTRAHRGS
jgi:hypothetical protein